jgi:hypothetical protein
LFIAGKYTPLLLVTLRSPLGWSLFGIVWGVAVAGVIFKVFFTKKSLVLFTLFYVLMGWMIVFAWHPLQTLLQPVAHYRRPALHVRLDLLYMAGLPTPSCRLAPVRACGVGHALLRDIAIRAVREQSDGSLSNEKVSQLMSEDYYCKITVK